MRIAHYLAFVPSLNFGMSEEGFVAYSSGHEPRSLLLAQLRDRLGWDVSIHVLSAGAARVRSEPPLRIPIHFHPLLGRPLLALLEKSAWARGKALRWLTATGIFAQVRRDPPGIFVFRGNMFASFSHLLARGLRRRGIPYLLENHGAGIVVNRKCRGFVLGASRIVVLSDETAQAFVRGYGVDPRRVTVISNGVDTGQFAPGARSGAGYPRLAFVGRPSHAKGFDLALEALVRARARWPGAVLEVAGTPLEGDRAFYDDALAGLDDGDRARLLLHGWVDKAGLVDLYRRADVLLFPSRIPGEGDGEGEPRAVLEAMACGLPVLAVAGSGGHCDVIARAGAGALAERAAGFAEAAARYLEDPERPGSERERARAHVLERHSIEAVYQAYSRCCIAALEEA